MVRGKNVRAKAMDTTIAEQWEKGARGCKESERVGCVWHVPIGGENADVGRERWRHGVREEETDVEEITRRMQIETVSGMEKMRIARLRKSQREREKKKVESRDKRKNTSYTKTARERTKN